MPKTLIGKTQKIAPKLGTTEASFSGIISISPDEEDSINKRGYLYAVFDLHDITKYETELTSKLIKDILGRSYYHSENSSPIQALEKAIVDVQEDILHLQENEDSGKITLNIIASVLWAGVLYTVKRGKGQISIVRGGDFKNIEMIKEGNFSVATGMVKSEDVVILATEEFAINFPHKKLLRLNPTEVDTLKPTESCLMIKFETPENGNEISSAEENFGKGIKKTGIIKKIAMNMKSITHRGRDITNSVTAIGIKKPRKVNKKLVSSGITGILGISLVFAILLTKNKGDTPGENQIQEPIKDSEEIAVEAPMEEFTLPAEVFYDLRIVTSLANPISLNLVDNKIYSLDKNGDLYVSEIDTPRFQKIPNTRFENAYIVKNKGAELFINDENIVKNYNPEDETTEETKVDKRGIFFPYLNALYQIENNSIKKYTLGDDTEGAVWAENDDFLEAKDMTIAVSIYVLTRDDRIVRYTSGVKDGGFSVKGMEKGLSGALKIETNWDWKNMYIADAGNGRVVVVTKEGNFVEEIKNESGDWKSIRAIAITEDESKLFVLDGTRVFEIEL